MCNHKEHLKEVRVYWKGSRTHYGNFLMCIACDSYITKSRVGQT